MNFYKVTLQYIISRNHSNLEQMNYNTKTLYIDAAANAHIEKNNLQMNQRYHIYLD